MNENELFISFLSGSPESLNWYDRRAFVKYALEACRNQHSFGSDRQAAMQSKGISEETMLRRIIAFWAIYPYVRGRISQPLGCFI
mgnify:CR=1 FL=1